MLPLSPVATFPLNEEDIFARVFLPRLKVHLRRRNILSQKRSPHFWKPPIKHWNFNQFPFQFDVGEIFNVSLIPRTFYRV